MLSTLRSGRTSHLRKSRPPIGVTLRSDRTDELFGEDQARYLIAADFDCAEALVTAASQSGVEIATVGSFGGTAVRYGSSEDTLEALSDLYRTSFATAIDPAAQSG